jgi:hypothetical protein
MERARKLYRLPANPAADVEKPRTASKTEIQVFSPEEIMALVRAADSEQDAAIYLGQAVLGAPDRAALALAAEDVAGNGSEGLHRPPSAEPPNSAPGSRCSGHIWDTLDPARTTKRVRKG